jgi:hypothetical protein
MEADHTPEIREAIFKRPKQRTQSVSEIAGGAPRQSAF